MREQIVRQYESLFSPFSRAAIVGKGQTGRMFFEQLLPVAGMEIAGINRTNWEHLQSFRPQLVIAAVPNPADDVLRQLAATVPDGTTVILPQNGVAVIQVAKQIFSPSTHLVRASLLTAVSSDENNILRYRTDKKIIGLAPVGDDMEAARKAAEMFRLAGFRTRVYEDAGPMETTKLLLNTIGSTSAVTGLTPLETFHDDELFSLEIRGLLDRIDALHRAGKKLVNFPGYPFVRVLDELVGLLQHAPRPMREHMLPGIASKFRDRIADLIAGGRANLPSSAARAIRQGKKTEVSYYHQPFIDLADEKYGCPVDETILEIVSAQEKGELHPNLNEIDAAEKRRLLLDRYHAHIHAETT